MSDMLKIGMRLVIITVIAALFLGLTNYVTREPIRLQRIETEKKAKAAALPKASSFNAMDIEEEYAEAGSAKIIEVSVAKASKEVIGYVFKVVANGYVDEIEIIVGLGMAEKIEGVQIGRQSETPGLGSKVKDRHFLEQFKGKNSDLAISVVKNLSGDQIGETQEIEAISGATISSNAVTSAINMVLDYYNIVILEKGEGDANVLPEAEDMIEEDLLVEYAEEGDARIVEVARGETNGELVGYVYTALAEGYHGEIEVFVGVNAENEIEAVHIGKQSEIINLNTPDLLDQYQGKKDTADVDSIAGVTISSEAVTRAVDMALDYHSKVNANGGGN